MGSNVSSVAGILAAGQTAAAGTGSKEEDLKIQFAQVMSQMTTQVGAGGYSGENGAYEAKAKTAAVTQTESYEQYQYRENGIKQQQGALEQVDDEQVQGELDSYESDVREVLKEELGVTDEQIEAAMEQLGMTAIDLMNPGQLANLVAELTGCEDAGELLCNSEFLDVLKEVGALTEELLQELGLTGEELKQAYEVLQNQAETVVPDSPEVENQMPETAVETEGAEPVETRVQDVQEGKQVTQTASTTENAQEGQQAEAFEQKETVTVDKTAKETAAVPEEKQTRETVTETEQETETVLEQETAGKGLTEEKTGNSQGQQTGNNLNQQTHADGTAGVQVNSQQQPVNAAAAEAVPEFARQLDTESIIRQIAEYTKVNISSTQTTMEMQLNPENLGKIYLEVTAKQGNVSAHIVAQNEFVKEALETQMAELKQNLNQAGVKVDAVEVTVGSHEFERNLEQNERQEERQAEEREKTSGKMRRLNLSDLDELAGVMSEEETLVAQMMADQGNSIDYIA